MSQALTAQSGLAPGLHAADLLAELVDLLYLNINDKAQDLFSMPALSSTA